MLRRLLAAGLVGGLIGGVLIALIGAVTTTPMILHAEMFESGHGGEEPGGLVRLAFTVLATMGVATAYAWILLAAMHVAGKQITARAILPWAVAGFLATGLAPAFGLAPALPGSAEADLTARQLWWLGTAAATAGGLAAIAFGRKPYLLALGVALIALPHLAGAPHGEGFASPVPAGLAASFAAASLGLQFLTWIIPAAIAGYSAARLDAAS